jgi:hypothetical protein
MDRPLPFRRLQAILARYGVGVDRSRGKGSHVLFFRDFPQGRFTYPVPTHGKDVLVVYVRGCRKRFRLTPVDGVSDDEFYA